MCTNCYRAGHALLLVRVVTVTITSSGRPPGSGCIARCILEWAHAMTEPHLFSGVRGIGGLGSSGLGTHTLLTYAYRNGKPLLEPIGWAAVVQKKTATIELIWRCLGSIGWRAVVSELKTSYMSDHNLNGRSHWSRSRRWYW